MWGKGAKPFRDQRESEKGEPASPCCSPTLPNSPGFPTATMWCLTTLCKSLSSTNPQKNSLYGLWCLPTEKAKKISLDGRKKSVGDRISVSFLGLGEDLCAAHEAEALLFLAWITLGFMVDSHRFSWLAPSFISGFPKKDFTALCCSSGSPPAPKGKWECCLSSLGFHTLLQRRQGGQIGHFMPRCTTKAAQLGVQVCGNDLACTSSAFSAVLGTSCMCSVLLQRGKSWDGVVKGMASSLRCPVSAGGHSIQKTPPTNNFCLFTVHTGGWFLVSMKSF